MLTESLDSNVKNVPAGLLRAAPAVARLRELIDAGARLNVGFVPDLVEAVRRYASVRRDGLTVDRALSQGSLIGGGPSPRVEALMRNLEADARAPKRIAEMALRYVGEIDAQGDPRQERMFGED